MEHVYESMKLYKPPVDILVPSIWTDIYPVVSELGKTGCCYKSMARNTLVVKKSAPTKGIEKLRKYTKRE